MVNVCSNPDPSNLKDLLEQANELMKQNMHIFKELYGQRITDQINLFKQNALKFDIDLKVIRNDEGLQRLVKLKHDHLLAKKDPSENDNIYNETKQNLDMMIILSKGSLGKKLHYSEQTSFDSQKSEEELKLYIKELKRLRYKAIFRNNKANSFKAFIETEQIWLLCVQIQDTLFFVAIYYFIQGDFNQAFESIRKLKLYGFMDRFILYKCKKEGRDALTFKNWINSIDLDFDELKDFVEHHLINSDTKSIVQKYKETMKDSANRIKLIHIYEKRAAYFKIVDELNNQKFAYMSKRTRVYMYATKPQGKEEHYDERNRLYELMVQDIKDIGLEGYSNKSFVVAIEKLTRAICMREYLPKSDYINCLYHRGMAYEKLNNLSAAILDFQHAAVAGHEASYSKMIELAAE